MLVEDSRKEEDGTSAWAKGLKEDLQKQAAQLDQLKPSSMAGPGKKELEDLIGQVKANNGLMTKVHQVVAAADAASAIKRIEELEKTIENHVGKAQAERADISRLVAQLREEQGEDGELPSVVSSRREETTLCCMLRQLTSYCVDFMQALPVNNAKEVKRFSVSA